MLRDTVAPVPGTKVLPALAPMVLYGVLVAASSVGAIEGGAWMITVRVDVEVRPDWSVAT